MFEGLFQPMHLLLIVGIVLLITAVRLKIEQNQLVRVPE